MRIGDAVLVGLPGEVYVEYGLKIKHAFPDHRIIVVGLANDEIGYVPTPEAFEEGWYETKPWWFSKVAPDCGEVLTREAISMVEQVLMDL